MKNKLKVGPKMASHPNAPIDEIVRHLRKGEMLIINSKIEKIRSTIAVIYYMADEGILGESSDGLTHILDNNLVEVDELRRSINGETEEEETRRIRKEREAA